MTPRRRLGWGSAEEFRAPRPGGLSVEQAGRKVDTEFGEALAVLGREVASAYGIPRSLMVLAWFLDEHDLVRCVSCRCVVPQHPGGVLRCPECGASAEIPEGWSR